MTLKPALASDVDRGVVALSSDFGASTEMHLRLAVDQLRADAGVRQRHTDVRREKLVAQVEGLLATMA